ncbi:putative membrane protein [Mycoplasma testudineum]|uniref:Putative membrane protein n=1 Tax=Mycoplasma testudineum TaxID=244584 RepID=A0A4R6IH86_9MOLU|nr:hypothetical protein [Mycoplasma testudineum]OYD27090.1 hypothetical protein CG473_00345 [Mycoplasma testudineum]TDO21157.1 putative membrane protein [Mycoplasma testudineum]
MKQKKVNLGISTHEIAVLSLLMALTVAFSFFRIPIGTSGNGIYLIGIIVFLSPVIMKNFWTLVPVVFGVLIADLIAAYPFWYFSILIYGISAIILVLATKIKKLAWLFYFIALFFTLLFQVGSYFLINYFVYGLNTSVVLLPWDFIQSAIIFSIIIILYLPINKLMDLLYKDKANRLGNISNKKDSKNEWTRTKQN